ncbi:hypothetical protein Brsp07_04540 [Brucella sp. NBRC 14130]|uniref:recombinase family protein n=1 Tax=Brucella sp. NBRC 14130 TaxID=3075483 RepID=UPI0030A5F765
MQYGYIRLSKSGPGQGAQRAALAAAGIDEDGTVFVEKAPKGRRKPNEDALPQRTAAINGLAPGDELVIANAACLGTSLADLLTALVAIGERQAMVRDAASGQLVRWHPDVMETVAFLERAEIGRNRNLTALMRTAKEESGVHGGKPPKFTAEQLSEARALWEDERLTGQQVASRTGISYRTLYRELGPRGTPRFGHRSDG